MKECEALRELIHAYLDKELSFEEMHQVESHLAACQACQKRLAMFRGLKIALKQKITSVSAPVSLRERITQKTTKPVFSRWLFPRWGIAVAAVLIIVVGVIFIYQSMIRPSHFLVIRASLEIQEHLDKCNHDRKGTIKILENHMEMVSSPKSHLQKHLDNCPDCRQRIVKMIKECMDRSAWLPLRNHGESKVQILAGILMGRRRCLWFK